MRTFFIRPVFPFTILVLLISSCCGKMPNITLHYSDGTIMHDSTEIHPVMQEFLRIRRLHGLPVENVHIYTALQPGVSRNLRNTQKQLENRIAPLIKTDHNDTLAERKLKEAIANGNLLESGILVIDNHTGEILVNYNENATQDYTTTTCSRPLNTINNILLFTLAMERGNIPENRYPQRFIQSDDHGMHAPDTLSYRSYYSAFSRSYGNSSYGLHHQFSQKAQLAAQVRLHWGESSTGNCNDIICASLLDLTKTHTAFLNKGTLHNPYLIQKVTDGNGKSLYTKHVSENVNVLDSKTAHKMLQLLDYYADFGIGANVRILHPEAPDFYGNMMTTGLSRPNGYFITILPDYTIGVYYQINVNRVRYKNPEYNSLKTALSPLWLKTVQSLAKLQKYPVSKKELPRLCIPPEKMVISTWKNERIHLKKNRPTIFVNPHHSNTFFAFFRIHSVHFYESTISFSSAIHGSGFRSANHQLQGFLFSQNGERRLKSGSSIHC